MLESGEIVKICTAPQRELDFQGLDRLIFACLVVFVWVLVSGWLWEVVGSFWSPNGTRDTITRGALGLHDS